jgi:hypothetical protein
MNFSTHDRLATESIRLDRRAHTTAIPISADGINSLRLKSDPKGSAADLIDCLTNKLPQQKYFARAIERTAQ